MITTTGKSIIGKFLVGQVPAYASHIAVGCGAKPLKTTDTFADYSSKTSLDFEMFRVPIISSGLITEDGVTKVAFTGELPTTERYDITEIGIFSSATNPLAQGFDSRSIYSFGSTENWEFHSPSGSALFLLQTLFLLREWLRLIFQPLYFLQEMHYLMMHQDRQHLKDQDLWIRQL